MAGADIDGLDAQLKAYLVFMSLLADAQERRLREMNARVRTPNRLERAVGRLVAVYALVVILRRSA